MSHTALFDTAHTATRKTRCAKNSIEFDIEAFKELRAKRPDDDPAPASEQRSGSSPEDAQQRAITRDGGPCMVIAGPGAGKTFVLTERIVHLVRARNIPQEKILAITFSNRAADEMRHRLQKKLAPLSVHISTFHAFGLSILKEYVHVFGRTENFSILDEEEKKEIAAGIFGKKEAPRVLRSIAELKQGMRYDEGTRATMDSYNDALRQHEAFDLDDLLYLPVQLFSKDAVALAGYRKRFPWVLVDEYQDINPVQYELLRLLCGEGDPDLFVIGDPDQAIYGFRGSDVRYIDRLQKDYPELEIIRLSRSFRCPAAVLKAGGQVLQKDDCLEGIPSDIKIDVMECETDKAEADAIAARIEKMVGGVHSLSMASGISDGSEAEGISGFSDFAVLCRTSGMFTTIVQALVNHGIAAQVVDTDPFITAEPFKSILHCFKTAVVHPDGISDPDIRGMVAAKEGVASIISFLVGQRGLPDDARKRIVSIAAPYGSDYAAFFRDLALRKGMDDLEPGQEAVRVMTLHASKGLEFKAVFIPGCEEGILPFELFGAKAAEEREEEKRLFYVGITRTQKYLFLSHAKKRTFKGRLLQQEKSSFLDQLQDGLLNRERRALRKQDRQLELKLDP